MVTITSPKSVYVDNTKADTYTLIWKNTYSGQYSFEVLYKLKTSSSWLTTGKIISENTSYDLRNIHDLLGIDIDEIQYRLVVYYKTTEGIEIKDFSDAALIYSLIFNTGFTESLKVYDGTSTIKHPIFSTVENTALETLKIKTDEGIKKLPLVESNSPISSAVKIKTNKGIKHLASNNPKFSYDTSVLTTYGTVTAYYTTPNYRQDVYYTARYSSYNNLDSPAYNNYAASYYTKYTTVPASYYTTRYDGVYYTTRYNGRYYTTYGNNHYYTTYANNYRYYNYISSYYSYSYIPYYAYSYPSSYRAVLTYGVVGSYSYTYVKYATSRGPVYGGGGGPIYGTYYIYVPASYAYSYGPSYYTIAYPSTYDSRRYYYNTGTYTMTQYGPHPNYTMGYYNYIIRYAYSSHTVYNSTYGARYSYGTIQYNTYGTVKYNTYGTVNYNYNTAYRYNYNTVYNYNTYYSTNEINGYYISSVTPARYSIKYTVNYTAYYYNTLTGYTPHYYGYSYTVA